RCTGAAQRVDRLPRGGRLHGQHDGRRRHRGMTHPVDDRSDDEQRGLALLHEASDAILAGVERELSGWVERSVTRILDAWGRTPPDARERAERDAVEAGGGATRRVMAELRSLFALDPEQQRS